LFFKKFTEEEAKEWNEIATKAVKEVSLKYEEPLNILRTKLALRGKEALDLEEKKKLRAEQKQFEEKIEREVRAAIKKAFNYPIPIAEVEKAGISTTGAQIENELEPLAKEYNAYRAENKLWASITKEIKYELTNDEIGRVRVVDGRAAEAEVFYGKLVS